jgi:hemerythrin-like metal-binding protein
MGSVRHMRSIGTTDITLRLKGIAMEPMEWKSSYSVGVPVLDSDHKQLMDIINRIDEAGERRSSLQWVLQELTDYARVHFRREEEQLKSVDYPHLTQQISEHEKFVDWLSTLKETLGASPTSQIHSAEAVSNYLKSWLAEHILVSDMAYKEHLH